LGLNFQRVMGEFNLFLAATEPAAPSSSSGAIVSV
jgi:hypothetical protein